MAALFIIPFRVYIQTNMNCTYENLLLKRRKVDAMSDGQQTRGVFVLCVSQCQCQGFPNLYSLILAKEPWIN